MADGRDEDFAEFVLARTPALLRFAYLVTGDAHLAEDLTQEALVRAHRKWSSIVGDNGPEPYVRKIIMRQYLSWRRLGSSTEIPVAAVPDGPARQGDGSDVVERDALWTMLASLTRMQRAVVVLRYYEDLADEEIAQLLGVRRATVRVHAFHALATLRAALAAAPTQEARA